MFTLSSIYQATKELLGKINDDNNISDSDEKIATEYWTEVAKNIYEWELLVQSKVTSSELRRDFIHAHGVGLHALGIVGNALMKKHPTSWKKKLQALKGLDWSRSNSNLWEGRAMIGGRINKSRTNLLLTTNALKQVLDLELTLSEQKLKKISKK